MMDRACPAFSSTRYLAGRILTNDADVLIVRPSIVRHCMRRPLCTHLALWEATLVAHVAIVVAPSMEPILDT